MPEQFRLSKLRCLAIVLAAGTFSWAGTIEGGVHPAGTTVARGAAVVFVADIDEPPVHATAVMDQKHLEFVPHVLVVRRGTTVEFPNSDPLRHNVFSISTAKRFNLGMYSQGESRSLVFDKTGVVEILCQVHLEMSAYIIVVPNHYFAMVDPDGSFRIPDVPAGRHEVRYWQENRGEQVLTAQVPEKGSVGIRFESKEDRQRAKSDE